jgi:hypothetical protein
MKKLILLLIISVGVISCQPHPQLDDDSSISKEAITLSQDSIYLEGLSHYMLIRINKSRTEDYYAYNIGTRQIDYKFTYDTEQTVLPGGFIIALLILSLFIGVFFLE